MSDDLVVVLDCGATNARAIAVNTAGEIEGAAGRPSEPTTQPDAPAEWRIWPLEEVFDKLAEACREAVADLDTSRIRAVTVTTFGADGAPVDAGGSLTYPVISWQCTRTEELARNIDRYMDPWRLFETTGYQVIPFDTLLKFIWLRENAPDALESAECWMMMPGLLSFLLCGERSIDPTAAGTMMAMDMARRGWSEEILALAGLDASFFPRWVEPGEVIGGLSAQAAEATGLPAGIPVVAAGHDTQFAAVGSGAGASEAIVSSGTWEIAMLRQDRYEATRQGFEEGLLIEADAEKGLWNPQLLMMGSGVLEWIRDSFYGEIEDRAEAYPQMISEAEAVPVGSNGVTVLTSFVPDAGPTAKYHTGGTILGLGINTTRGEVYRAALEGLCCQLRYALEILGQCTGFEAEGIRVVGGGAKNALWNQLRADVTGLPVTTISNEEATVLGASIFAFMGAGIFSSVEEGRQAAELGEAPVEPSGERGEFDALYEAYREMLPGLGEVYDRSR
ncbi:MAG: L-fuculokinase [Armatimonadetes bacterium]|nr:L-fuculokinase [Armatimonadota bacterium]